MSLISSSRSVPGVWIVCANSTCFVGEVLVLVVGEQLREDQQRVERRAQLVRHVRQELALVLRAERELLGLLLERRRAPARPRGSSARPRAFCSREQLRLLLAAPRWSAAALPAAAWSSSSEALQRLRLLLELACSSARALPAAPAAPPTALCSSCVSVCDCSSSSSVRMFAMIVLSTTPIVSMSWSRNVWWISLNGRTTPARSPPSPGPRTGSAAR